MNKEVCMQKRIPAALAAAALAACAAGRPAQADDHREWGMSHEHGRDYQVQVGPRPYYLINDMDQGPLKRKLASCEDREFRVSKFSIGHRGGGTLQFPEETRESYEAGARMGAGILECDVTFTKDQELVCRHDQCDLATTTNVLTIPDLAAKCTEPFSPYDPATGKAASAKCCTSDFTVVEFKSLCGKMDGFNPKATTPAEFVKGTPGFRTDLYSTCGTVLTHKESIRLIDSLGRDFTPELKTPAVKMPFQGTFTQEKFAQKMIDEYKEMGISPKRVWAQSFLYDDIKYWLKYEPRFGRQAAFLDALVDEPGGYAKSLARLPSLARDGVRVLAPPQWVLVTLDADGKIIPSEWARKAKSLGLDIITWTLERSGPLAMGGGYYFQSVTPAIDNDGDTFTMLDVLARKVGILGIFSDWSGTVTYYANCMGLK
jgi:glycerophosphoryl diester phosphodiesterase